MKIDKEQWKWTREPKEFSISEDKMLLTVGFVRNQSEVFVR